MPQQHRPPRPKHIHKTIAVHVVQVRSLGTLHKRRMPANCAKSAYRRVHPTRQKSFSALL